MPWVLTAVRRGLAIEVQVQGVRIEVCHVVRIYDFGLEMRDLSVDISMRLVWKL